jgi:hypothetical protein
LPCILGFGDVNRRDILGRCVFWLFQGVMLKLAEDMGYVTRQGNVTCPVFVIPFKRHTRVYLFLPVSCELIAVQEGVSEVICMVLAHAFDCEIIYYE